ncbi:MAG: hypothetical protein Q8O13_07555 [Candidatus Omnitrophota bacterium]|nr:hypothetical protein [Candidatus Omnitrophota bacterium]
MKKKEKVLVVFLFLIAFLIPTQAQSQDVSLEREEIRREIDGLKAQINALEERLKASETKQKSTEERLKVTETRERETLAEMMTALGDKIEIGGELEFEYVDTQDDNITPQLTSTPGNPRGHFQMDKIRLKVKVTPDENKEFKFKLDFQDIEEKVSVDEAYFTFKNIAPFDQKISLGLKDRFIGGDFIEYYTEGSPLARTLFWKDPDLGIQYSGKKSPFYWHLSLTNGLQLKPKDIGEDSTIATSGANSNTAGRDDILQDDDENEDFGDNKQVGVGLGYEANLGEKGILNVLGFGYFSRLTSADLLSTTSGSTNYLNDSNDFPTRPADNTYNIQRRYGVNLAYTKDAWETYAQYIRAQDSYLRRHVLMLQTSYKFDVGWRYLKAIQPLFRWDYYMVRIPKTPTTPLTWDRRRYTGALLNHIKENLTLKLEYAHNREDTGGNSPLNDEFLAQLEYKF